MQGWIGRPAWCKLVCSASGRSHTAVVREVLTVPFGPQQVAQRFRAGPLKCWLNGPSQASWELDQVRRFVTVCAAVADGPAGLIAASVCNSVRRWESKAWDMVHALYLVAIVTAAPPAGRLKETSSKAGGPNKPLPRPVKPYGSVGIPSRLVVSLPFSSLSWTADTA